ncbi:MAG: hypothetical protein IJH41_01240 [Eubacterium sp.]|nr:hypothetical protein [Eubacterium sp.]
MNQKQNRTKRAIVLLLAVAMILTSVFSMPLSYAANENVDDLSDLDTMQVGVSGVVDKDAVVDYDPAYTLREGGCLADIAPTLIEMMGKKAPAEMTGQSLLIKK